MSIPSAANVAAASRTLTENRICEAYEVGTNQ